MRAFTGAVIAALRAQLDEANSTGTQSLGGALLVAVPCVMVTDLAWWQALAGSVVTAAVASAYLLMIARGVPADYQPTVVPEPGSPGVLVP